eukprot:TRINITY_DN24429_c0_g1_i1.p1 TRINITY_DN24429_c0_g1~~TRINITY_DN24429_c0_g1_i1.p1  ORF type:complete len:412 (-),score=120.04 TRINITY_DN24429_c0_g1_i1:643-1878(-)
MDSPLPCICLVCGIPGAGKSTITRQSRFFPSFIHAFPIEYDQVEKDIAASVTAIKELKGRDMTDQKVKDTVHHQRTPETWKKARKVVLGFVSAVVESGFRLVHWAESYEMDASNGDGEWTRMVWGKLVEQWNHFRQEEEDKWRKSSRKTLHDGQKHCLVLILDDNFFYPSMRYPFLQLCRKYSAGFCVVEVISSLAECLKRNSRRPLIDRVKDSTLTVMKHQFVSPSEDPQLWERYVLRMPNDDYDDDDETDEHRMRVDVDVWGRLIVSASEDPPMPFNMTEEKDQEMIQMEQDRIHSCSLHQLDLGLRTMCGNIMRETIGITTTEKEKEKLKELGKTLNLMKKRTFETFKKSQISAALITSMKRKHQDQDQERTEDCGEFVGNEEEEDISFILEKFESIGMDEAQKVMST